MSILLLGDPHLQSNAVPVLDAEYDDIEFVILVGDLVDRGCRNPAAGVAMLESLVDAIAPVGFVTGNHDYPYRERLSAVDQVTDLAAEDAVVCGARFVGNGCQQFDAGPEVPYLAPPFDGDRSLVDRWLEAYRQGETDTISSTGAAISVEDVPSDGLSAYDTRRSAVEARSDTDDESIVLVSHLPPFDTPLDLITNSRSRLQGKHWGSIAIRHLLRHQPLSLCLSGHIHGSAGVETVEQTVAVNAGYRRAWLIDGLTDHPRVAEVDIQYE